MTTWNSGARSIAVLHGNGYYSWRMSRGSVAVVCGLNDSDLSANPGEIEHAFIFENGYYRVVENGASKTSNAYFAEEERFAIVRFKGVVYYCVGETPTTIPAVPLQMPGTVVYTSAKESAGDVFLDASLFVAGDQILCAELNTLEGVKSGVASIAFKPMEMIAAEGDYAITRIAFEPMTVDAYTVFETRANISFEPMQAIALDGGVSVARMSFEPMTVTAEATDINPVLAGADMSMQPMGVFASALGNQDTTVEIAFEPMAMIAADGDYAVANMSFLPMTMFATGWHVPTEARFNILLPAVVGYDANVIKESAIIRDYAYGIPLHDILEHAVINDILTPTAKVKADILERARVFDASAGRGKVVADVLETAELNDYTVTDNVRGDALETAVITDAATPVSRTRADITETAAISDAAIHAARGDIHETATLDDGYVVRAIARPTITETAELNDYATNRAIGRADVLEQAVLNDATHPYALAREIVVEQAFVSGNAVPPRRIAAYTANTFTWGMSEYTDCPNRGFNARWGVGDGGLFVRDGTLDGYVTTGRLDLGSPKQKTVQPVYVYGDFVEPCELSVTADARRVNETVRYETNHWAGNGSRAVRFDIGKGFRSTYFQFTVHVEEASVIHRAEVATAELGRAI